MTEDEQRSNRGRRGSFGSRNNKRESFRGGRKRFSSDFQYPTGGTKQDPLNLNAIMSGDEMVVMNADEGSKPLDILIPKNLRDPLNLNKLEKQRKRRKAVDDQTALDTGVVSPIQRHKQIKRHRNHSSAESFTVDGPSGSKDATETKKNKQDYFNKRLLFFYFHNINNNNFFRYCYGNFDRYYGTRLDPGQKDSRLAFIKREWIEKKSVLDIGCNVGFLTLSLAKDYSPRRILGIDIDEHLIGVARKNIRHYCDQHIEFIGKFPASFCNNFGPISNHSLSFSTKFPDNVWFRKENYVLENDELLETVEEEFDVILALSITKWIHLNFGDDGLRRFFRRAFNQLMPGGRFILEPQPFASYRKRAKMTDVLKQNYSSIEFKPEDFEMYLIEEVGFESVEHLGAPNAKSKGFERPVDVYVKRQPRFMEKNKEHKSDISTTNS
uniref:RNA methyltransferase n=1 Tax=Heterorhabditis bacteriophora TaxID=37862 RepID=A0A1I7XAD2_HETBA